ncbi:uncharacterized protein B0I36DRAFT_110490 [Microdochium trichocladiopsis]|uniref:NACHT domain-containing protein n=1 Tax=Microdochium trichocladiopsis TaxID=1682393 RepID=A0A9P8YA99_9PEZI|nr:uncharacterized protein B0I36DRAFT_110490 [Microdochium trichocladiopsis]KAH7033561.1 hypothetical protein B0I36DRAFT_110490 [Microdochium trichocladiopsis]
MDIVSLGSRTTASNDPQRSLNDALASFRGILTADQLDALNHAKPEQDVDKVMIFTAELDQKAKSMKGRSVATRLHAVLEAVHLFSTVVDTFVSSNPEIAALVWGSIKMTMLIMVNYTSYFEPLSKLFMTISTHCPRFNEYQALFPISIRLQKALCDFHAAIVRCRQHLVEFMKRTWSQQLLNAVFQSFEQEFKPDIDGIARLAKEVKEEINLATTLAQHQEQQCQGQERKAAQLSRYFLQRYIPKLDQDLQFVKIRQSKQERIRLLEQLCSYNHLPLFKDTCKKRRNGTADWLLSTTEFTRWCNGTGSAVLCCYGKIGSGKTVLCTNVINNLYLHMQPRTIVAFFLAHYDNAESLLADTMIRSILKQSLVAIKGPNSHMNRLAELLNKPYVPLREWTVLLQQLIITMNNFYIVVDGLNECTSTERRLLMDELSLISEAAPSLRLFFSGRDSILIDVEQKFGHISKISTVSEGLRTDISLFIESVLEECFENGDLVVEDAALKELIVTTLNDRADGMFLLVVFLMQELCIASYKGMIRETLATLPKSLEQVYTVVLERILADNNMVEAVETAFRWVVAVARPLTLAELQETIPIEINQPYSMAEKQIPNFERIVLWSGNLLQCSEEEPRLIRFAHPTIREFLTNGSLPPHLGRFRVDTDLADHFVGEICMTYLDFNDFKTEVARAERPTTVTIQPLALASTALGNQSATTRLANTYTWLLTSTGWVTEGTFDIETNYASTQPYERDKSHPFLQYARIYWIVHTKHFDANKSKTWPLLRLVAKEGHNLIIWPGQERPESPGANLREWLEHNDHYALFLVGIQDWLLLKRQCQFHHCACFLLNHRASTDLDLIEQHLRGRSPAQIETFLSAARLAGLDMYDLFGILLEAVRFSDLAVVLSPAKGCSNSMPRSMQVHRLEFALVAASELGLLDVVKWLLKREVTVRNDLKIDEKRTALGRAARKGHCDVVRELLDHAADVDITDSQGFTPLHEAARNGHAEVVKILLSARANTECRVTMSFNDHTPRAWTALELAARGHFYVIVDLLYDRRVQKEQIWPQLQEDLTSGIIAEDLSMQNRHADVAAIHRLRKVLGFPSFPTTNLSGNDYWR